MTNPPRATIAGEVQGSAGTVERERVQEFLRSFGKTARAHQQYPSNNPVYKAAHDALRNAFTAVLDGGDSLTLAFTENEVRWEGEVVLEEPARSSDSLPWIFYKDGVREVKFERGAETEELDKLLDILQRVRKASPEEDDLLTLLWQGDFIYLKYRYVDLSVEATVPLAEGGEALAGSDDEAKTFDAEDAHSTSNVINMSDFDATLYFLDEREIEYLQTEIRSEYQRDLRSNVVNALLDIFEQQPDAAIRTEVGEALDSLLLLMLSGVQFSNVAHLLRESLVSAGRATHLTDDQKNLLAQLPVRLSKPEALSQLLQSLDEAVELPPADDVLAVFEQLTPAALSTILDWLGRIQNVRLRPLLEQAASRLASANTAELVKLIGSPTQHVSLEAIKRAGAMQTPAAVAPLAKVLLDGTHDLRLASVQALNEIGSPGALQTLERAIDDSDRDIRVAAIRVLMMRAYRPALPKLDAMVKGKAIRDADLTEKMAVFEAYGALCGDNGVPGLDAMLNGKSLFGRREDAEMRACAAVALGRVQSSNASEALRKAANEKDVVVRNAVTRALRRSTL